MATRPLSFEEAKAVLAREGKAIVAKEKAVEKAVEKE